MNMRIHKSDNHWSFSAKRGDLWEEIEQLLAGWWDKKFRGRKCYVVYDDSNDEPLAMIQTCRKTSETDGIVSVFTWSYVDDYGQKISCGSAVYRVKYLFDKVGKYDITDWKKI